MSNFKVPEFVEDGKTIAEALSISEQRKEELKDLSSEALTKAVVASKVSTEDVIQCFISFAKTPHELVYQAYQSGRMVVALNTMNTTNPLLRAMIMSSTKVDS